MTKQSNSFLFHVSSRGTRGGNNKDIRKNGDIPGNIFGLSLDSTMISCPLKMVQKHRSDFEGGLFYVQIDSGEKIPVVLEEIQEHPVTHMPLHIVFKRVNLLEKIEMDVPVEMIGECDVPDSNILLVRDELPIEALPSDIPEKFEIDISKLTEIGQSLTVADIIYDKSLITLQLSEEELEAPLVLLQEPRAEEVEAPVEAVEATDGEASESAADEKTTENSADESAKKSE